MIIVTDSAADLTQQEIRDNNIHIVPQFINFPNEEISAEDITADAFYERLKAMVPQVPKTSQPSPGMFVEAYKAIAASGDKDILSVHVSSGLSGTYNSARTAAEQVTDIANVTVVDTMTLSCGERFQVLTAVMAAQKGWETPRILERLKQIQKATELIYTLETLDYLARGGRIGRVQALAGSILSIKPIIKVDREDGKYSTLGRGRTISQTITTMVNHIHGLYGDQPVWVTVMHGQFADRAIEFEKQLRDKLTIERFDANRISPVLGVHTGPGIVGGAIMPMSLINDLL